MQMSINFKKLFNFDESGSNTPSTSSLQNSYHIDEPSMISTASNNINIHYKFNEGFFFDTSHQSDQKGLNISEDLSSIGRSFDEDYQQKGSGMKHQVHKQQHKSKTTTQNYKNNNEFKNNTKGQQTFYLNEKDNFTKTPGERLYYESKIKYERKLKQLQRIKMQLQQQEAKQITFKPALNQKSKKILQLADSPLQKMENMKKGQKQHKSVKQLKSTVQRKQQEQLKNCTFKPAILKTPKSIIPSTPNRSSNKDLSNVFQSLYNEHRAKIQRKRKLLQQQEYQKKSKTMTKQQLQEFFHRNKQYIEQKRHRQQLLKAVSSQYDLTSGRKLFQPKINASSTSGQLISSLSMAKFSNSQQQNINKTQMRNKQGNSSSPKNKISNKSNKKKVNDNLKKTAQQRRSKPMAYQVTKFVTEQNQMQDYEQHSNNIEERHKLSQQSNLQFNYLSNTKSSIFNKMAITESLIETHEQERLSSQSEQDKIGKQEQQKYQGYGQNPQQDGFQEDQQRQYRQEDKQKDFDQDGMSQKKYGQTNMQQNIYQKNHQYELSNKREQQILQSEKDLNQNKIKGQLNNSYHQQQAQYNQQEQRHDIDNDNYQSQRSLPHQPSQPLFTNQNQDDRDIMISQKLSIDIQKEENHKRQSQPLKQIIIEQEFLPYQQQVNQCEEQYQHQMNNQNYQQHHEENDYEQHHEENNYQQHYQQNNDQQFKQQNDIVPQQEQYQQPSLNSRKQSQDDDVTKRTNFLQSIVKNPIYTHKYNDLFALDQNQSQQLSYIKKTNKTTIKQSNKTTIKQSTNYPQYSLNCSKEQLLPILNPNQTTSINTQIIHQQPPNSTHKPSLFKPIFLAKDSEQQQTQQKTSPKSWQQIFNSSNKIQKTLNPTPSQSGFSSRSRISQIKASSNLTPEQSPKKKSINIASLLKGKKKLTPKQ